MSSAWAVLLWEINFVLREAQSIASAQVLEFETFRGLQRALALVTMPAGWKWGSLPLPAWDAADPASSQPSQHPTLVIPALSSAELLGLVRGHVWHYAGTSLIQQKLLEQQSWNILCQEIFCCCFLFPLFCGEISCLLTCFGMRKWKMIVSMNRLT